MIWFILVLVVIGIIAYCGSKADPQCESRNLIPAENKEEIPIEPDNWEKEQEEKYNKYLIEIEEDYKDYLNNTRNEKILEILEKGSVSGDFYKPERIPTKYGRLLCVELTPDNVLKSNPWVWSKASKCIIWRTKENGTYVKWDGGVSASVDFGRKIDRIPAHKTSKFELIGNKEFEKYADCKDKDNNGNYILERI